MTNGWFVTEYDNEQLWIRIRKKIAAKKTRFQDVQILDSYKNGKLLAIDGEVQSAQVDEYIYHEALVHPALMMHPNPKNVLILGVGEGASVREVLKHKTVKNIVGIEIDNVLVDLVKRHLPEWHQGAFEDERFNLHIADAADVLKERRDLYDIIISDLTDPGLDSPANQFYTKEFHRLLRSNLSNEGIMVTQTQSADPGSRWHSAVYNTLKTTFYDIVPYYAYLESFRSLWSFMVASAQPLKKPDVERLIRERDVKPLKFYNQATHDWMFFQPPYIRIEQPGTVPTLTRANVNKVVRRVIADEL
jgi:spermidine synthase